MVERLVRPKAKRKPDGTFIKGVAANPAGHNGMPATMTERQKFREAFHVALDATPKAITICPMPSFMRFGSKADHKQ